ncbi:unnamed protein product, partial [Pleuronectes platessa]
FNHNGVDLNRNFPDAFAGLRRQQKPDEEKREAEVRAVIGWLKTETFVLSANLHGGALVASYPYDNSNGGSEQVGGASIAPDDDVFINLAKVYSHNHGSMHRGGGCDVGATFVDGITNGFLWYPLEGGMQDYNYVWAQCLELTLEISCCKFPPVSELPALWADNRKSLLAFIQQVHLGVKGRVFDSSGRPTRRVLQTAAARNLQLHSDVPGSQGSDGDSHRAVRPDRYSAMKHDFLLQLTDANSPQANPTSVPPTATPTCNYTLNLEGGSCWFLQVPAGSFRFLLVPSGSCWFLLVPQVPAGSSGSFRFLLVPSGSFRFLLVPSGSCWFLQVPAGSFRFLLVPPGSCWFLQVPSGSCWFLQVPAGSFRFLLVPSGSCWFLLVPPGSCWFLQVPSGSCWFLQVPSGSCWFLQVPAGSSRFLLVPSGSCWFLQVPAGSFRFLQVPACSFRFLLGSCWFLQVPAGSFGFLLVPSGSCWFLLTRSSRGRVHLLPSVTRGSCSHPGPSSGNSFLWFGLDSQEVFTRHLNLTRRICTG